MQYNSFLKIAYFLLLFTGCNITFSGFISQVDFQVFYLFPSLSGNLQIVAVYSAVTLLQLCNLQIS